MAARGFGSLTLTGSAQPLFGTQTGAPIRPTPDMRTGTLAVASSPSQAVISVTANIFRPNDRVQIGPSSGFVTQFPSPYAPDGGVVSAIDTAANTITVNGLLRAHNASEWVVLAIPCSQIGFLNGAATIYLGEDSTVAVTSPTLIDEIAATTRYTIGSATYANVLETQHLWVNGTAADLLTARNLITI